MIKFNDPFAIHMISKAVNVPFIITHHQCLARFEEETGRLLGGIFYTDYNTKSIHMHVAGFSDHWLNRGLLWVAFDYPFNRLHVKKVLSPIPETNKKSVAFCMNLGFTIEATISDVFEDGGLHVAALYKKDCRFLKMSRPKSLTVGSNNGKIDPQP